MNVKYRLVIIIMTCVILWKTYEYWSTYSKSSESDIYDDSYLRSDVESVKVTVYYEALCSDSRNFILNQLVPTYEKLKQHIALDLVPYGKAQTTENGGALQFQCQHGSSECLANKIHACGINVIKNQNVQLKYVSCMISDNMIPYEALERCTKQLQININPIMDCANGQMGSILLKNHGIRTHNVTPLISFIPTIELNSSQKISLQSILKDFHNQICTLYEVKPKACM